MVGGDAVALTVPEIRRRPGADSDLLPSDLLGCHVRVVASALLHALRPQGGVRPRGVLNQKVDDEF
jgi:hypothetical protein